MKSESWKNKIQEYIQAHVAKTLVEDNGLSLSLSYRHDGGGYDPAGHHDGKYPTDAGML